MEPSILITKETWLGGNAGKRGNVHCDSTRSVCALSTSFLLKYLQMSEAQKITLDF